MNANTSDQVTASDLKPQEAQADLKAELTKAQEEIEQHNETIAQLKDQVARLNAQHVNQLRQLEKNTKSKEAFAISKFAKEVVAIADVLETGIAHIEDQASEHYRGMIMTLDKLNLVLKEHDVFKMSPLGDKFDSNQHEAITTQETDEMEQNHVLQVLQAGYLMKDRVLRHAKVIVSKEISTKG
ncbi:nucleotide exchange factor GrpE [Gammaproteobacteria bacterium]|nr:nucleotide exchange factor GrpE [Gammaproteobacteria bacterium]